MHNNYSETVVSNEILVLRLPPTMLKQFVQKKITQVKSEMRKTEPMRKTKIVQ